MSKLLRSPNLLRRETPEGLKRFHDRWIPLEEAYFTAYRLPDAGCILLNGET